jgi:hypothetical protein
MFRSQSIIQVVLTPVECVRRERGVISPLIVRIFHINGSVAKTIGFKWCDAKTKVEFMLPRVRESKKNDTASAMASILFVTVESVPRIPIIVTYRLPVKMLINAVLRLNDSVFSQHEALASLHRILIGIGDDGVMTIIKFLSDLSMNNNVFFSLRCHAIHILTTMLGNDIHSAEAVSAKESLLGYLQQVLDLSSLRLEPCVSEIHPMVLVLLFRAVAKIPVIRDDLTSYRVLRSVLREVYEGEISPALLLCFQETHISSREELSELTTKLLEILDDGLNNACVMKAALRVFARSVSSLSRPTAERVLNAMMTLFEDKAVHFVCREAICELLLRNFGEEFVPVIIRSVKKDLRLDCPSWLVIEHVLKILKAFFRCGKGPVAENMRRMWVKGKMLAVLCEVHGRTMGVYDLVNEDVRVLFEKLVGVSWNFFEIPGVRIVPKKRGNSVSDL